MITRHNVDDLQQQMKESNKEPLTRRELQDIANKCVRATCIETRRQHDVNGNPITLYNNGVTFKFDASLPLFTPFIIVCHNLAFIGLSYCGTLEFGKLWHFSKPLQEDTIRGISRHSSSAYEILINRYHQIEKLAHESWTYCKQKLPNPKTLTNYDVNYKSRNYEKEKAYLCRIGRYDNFNIYLNKTFKENS